MWVGKCFPNFFTLLLRCETAHGRLEKENSENGKEDEKFENNKPYQRTAPGHIPEPIPVKGIEKRKNSL